MKLHNEFTVDAAPHEVWSGLLDLERVEVHRGTMRVADGPMELVYDAVARVTDVDEDNRTASFEVTATEAVGQGTASATITSRLEQRDGVGTLVVADTDLHVTGPLAQFGHGVMQDVASGMLGELARRLSDNLSTPATAASEPVEKLETRPLRRYLLITGAAAAVLLVVGGLLRKRQ